VKHGSRQQAQSHSATNGVRRRASSSSSNASSSTAALTLTCQRYAGQHRPQQLAAHTW
jgi:hypothetical protein